MKVKKYLNLLLNPLKTETIAIAIKIKIFDLLQDALALENILKEVDFNTKNTKIFLNALVQLKLLKYKNNLYKNSAFSNKYFVSSSQYYIGDLFLLRKEYFESSKNALFNILKNGYQENINSQDSKQWAKSSKKYFYQEQKALLSDLVVDVVEDLNSSKNIKKILDIGCNSGVLSLELLKSNSDFEAILFDFQAVIKQTKKNIKSYKLEKRATTLHGDIQKDDIKDGYDLVICSNILHLLPQQEMVLKKIYNSLNKNGTLLIIQSNLLEKSSYNKDNYFYNFIPMLHGDKFVKSYPSADVLLNSGYKNVNSFISDKAPYLNTKIYIAKK